jgi:hypothetical protein
MKTLLLQSRTMFFGLLVFAMRLMAQSGTFEPVIGDYNGDGYPDMAVWNVSENKWDIYLSCGGVGFAPPVQWSGFAGTIGPVRATDLNGDRKADLIVWNAAINAWSVNLSTGNGFTQETWFGMSGSDGPMFVGDLNGDGKEDVFMWKAANNTWSVNLSTGHGFTPQSWTGAWGSDGPIQIGDLNGDGKLDVFMWRDSDKVWTVNLSTGKGFDSQIWKGAWGSDGPIHVGDLNGDGKADVFMWRDSDKVWTVNLSTGKGFDAQIWKGAWGSDGPIYVGDLNGDKKVDVFMWRTSDKVWTVNLSNGKGFDSDIWKGNPGAGTVFVADLNKDKKADMVVWNAGDNAWSVNLSTGQGWTAASWPAVSTPTPSLKTFYVVTPPIHPTDPVILGYSIGVPPNCKLNVYINALDAHGGGIDGFNVPNPQPSGTTSVSGYSYPAYFTLQAGCLGNSACVQDSETLPGGVLTVPGPPVVTIASFSGSGGGMSAVAPNELYVPVGTPIKLSWTVENCGAGCNISLQSTYGTFPTKTGLPTTGTTPVAQKLTNEVYVLTATDSTDPTKTSKLPVNLSPPATQCPNCQWFYFKVTSPPGAAVSECFTVATYQSSLTAAQTAMQQLYGGDAFAQITVDQYYSNDTCNQ